MKSSLEAPIVVMDITMGLVTTLTTSSCDIGAALS